MLSGCARKLFDSCEDVATSSTTVKSPCLRSHSSDNDSCRASSPHVAARHAAGRQFSPSTAATTRTVQSSPVIKSTPLVSPHTVTRQSPRKRQRPNTPTHADNSAVCDNRQPMTMRQVEIVLHRVPLDSEDQCVDVNRQHDCGSDSTAASVVHNASCSDRTTGEETPKKTLGRRSRVASGDHSESRHDGDVIESLVTHKVKSPASFAKSPGKRGMVSPLKRTIVSPLKRDLTSALTRGLASPLKREIMSLAKDGTPSPSKRDLALKGGSSKREDASLPRQIASSPSKRRRMDVFSKDDATSSLKRSIQSPSKSVSFSPSNSSISLSSKPTVTSPSESLLTPSLNLDRELQPARETSESLTDYTHTSSPCKRSLPLLLRPRHFLRCHSAAPGGRSAAAADTSTLVADCQWEPDVDGGGGGRRLASCGGRVVCVLDVSTQPCRLLQRFTDDADRRQQFVALAWTRLLLDRESARRIAVLAVAGRAACVSLLHPDRLTRYCRFSTHTGHTSWATAVTAPAGWALTALAFHPAPERAGWLFCGSEACGVTLWDIGVPCGVGGGGEYTGVRPRRLLHVSTEARQVLCLLAGASHLLAGTDAELFVWPLLYDNNNDDNNNNTSSDRHDKIPANASDINAGVSGGGDCSSCEPVRVGSVGGFETSPQEGAVHGVAWVSSERRVAVALAALNGVVVWRLADLLEPSLADPFDASHFTLPVGERWQRHLAGVRRKQRPAVVMPGMSAAVCHDGGDWLVCGDNGGALHMWRVPPAAETSDACSYQQLAWPQHRLVDDALSSAGKLLPRAATVALGRAAVNDGRSTDGVCSVAVCSDVNLLCVWRAEVATQVREVSEVLVDVEASLINQTASHC